MPIPLPSPNPLSPVTIVENAVTDTRTWLEKHTVIILVTLGLGVVTFLGSKYLNHVVNVDNQKVLVTQQALDSQKTANAALATEVQTATVQYQSMVDALTKQNASLAAAITQRNTVLVQQQTADKTLPPSALAARWSTLINHAPSDLVVTAQGIEVSNSAALDSLLQIEQVPVLTQNLKDQTAQTANVTSELNSANGVITSQKNDITGLNAQIVDSQKACNATVADLKAKANKSRLKFFGIGYVAGFVSGLLVHGA